ncbi:MAG: protein translocase subunit SecF [Desulfarculus sp.]|nr:protein translocase subunit SecF [Desulfarculus sp.]
MQLIKPDINIDFMGKKNLLMAISALLLVAAMIPLIVKGGFNYGIDFSGGLLAQVKFAKPTEPGAIRAALKPMALDDSQVQSFGKAEDNEFLVRAQKPDLNLEGLGEGLNTALKAVYSDGFEVRRVETVGAKVGKDLRQKALLAIFFSLLLMAVYISGRFEAKWILSGVMAAVLAGVSIVEYWLLAEVMHLGETVVIITMIVTCLVVTALACWVLRLRYAMGAVVSLTHDVLITVGIYTMLGGEFNLSTVAAVLTVIGYSINDTIIVYDRIRENLHKNPRQDMQSLVNDSVNQTLSRTILTVGTVLMVLVALVALGGGVIEEFALALLIGTAVGTYSSVYMASPMLLLMPTGGGLLSFSAPAAKAAKPVARPTSRPAARSQAPAQEDEEGTEEKAPRQVARTLGTTTRPRGSKQSRGKRKKK